MASTIWIKQTGRDLMALSEKWEALLGGGDSDHSRSAPMTLASHDDGGGMNSDGGSSQGGAPDLKSSQGPWTRAAGVAGELRVGVVSALTDLTTAFEDAPIASGGFGSTVALAEVRTSWEKRLASVRDECGRLQTTLRAAGRGDASSGRGTKAWRPAGFPVSGFRWRRAVVGGWVGGTRGMRERGPRR
jgi:hypothetical protein